VYRIKNKKIEKEKKKKVKNTPCKVLVLPWHVLLASTDHTGLHEGLL